MQPHESRQLPGHCAGFSREKPDFLHTQHSKAASSILHARSAADTQVSRQDLVIFLVNSLSLACAPAALPHACMMHAVANAEATTRSQCAGHRLSALRTIVSHSGIHSNINRCFATGLAPCVLNVATILRSIQKYQSECRSESLSFEGNSS